MSPTDEKGCSVKRSYCVMVVGKFLMAMLGKAPKIVGRYTPLLGNRKCVLSTLIKRVR
jgi:hypothetical protein